MRIYIIVWKYLFYSEELFLALVGLLAMNSFSFYLEMFFISPLYLKNSFAMYKILVWENFFPFGILNMSFYYHLDIIVSDEKSSINFIGVPCTWWVMLSCCFQSFIFVSGFQHLTTICFGVKLFAFILLGVYWIFWMHELMLFIKYGKF